MKVPFIDLRRQYSLMGYPPKKLLASLSEVAYFRILPAIIASEEKDLRREKALTATVGS
ncbi:MAG: hypothetical protein ABIJ27_06375 [Candidatus Omnitrophota bacterium]